MEAAILTTTLVITSKIAIGPKPIAVFYANELSSLPTTRSEC